MKQFIYLFIFVFLFAACSDKETGSKSGGQISDVDSPEYVKEYYSTLQARMKKGIMLGHQDALAYGNMWYGETGRSDVKSICGDYPAVVGWDLGAIENNSAFNLDSVSFDKIRQYIRDVDQMKGITTLSWRTSNPTTDSIGTNIVTSILPEKENHNKYLLYLDRLADFFLSLKDEKGRLIPVIFRPFHEADNSDYWWSTKYCSQDEYKELWATTVNYLRQEKNIHHVLYAYSAYRPTNTEEFLNNYPGDEYVDIVGADLYLKMDEDPDGKKYIENLDKSLSTITKFAEQHNKISALTDTGLEGVKISNFFSGLVSPVISKYKISYILFGRNAWNMEEHYHIPIPGHPAGEDFIKFANNPLILTSKKLEKTS